MPVGLITRIGLLSPRRVGAHEHVDGGLHISRDFSLAGCLVAIQEQQLASYSCEAQLTKLVGSEVDVGNRELASRHNPFKEDC